MSTFVPDSLQVNHLNLSGGPNGVEVKDLVTVNEVETTPGVNGYRLDDNGKGFTLNLGNINSAYRITYKTSLANTYINGNYKNNASLTDDPDGVNKELFKKGVTVTPKHGGEVISKTGVQGTGANEDTATWTIYLNRSQSHISSGSQLSDELEGEQVLIPSSIKVYKPTVATDGTITTPWTEINEGFTLSNDTKSFTLTFTGSVDTAYIVQYQSFINANNGETIKNKAKFETNLGMGQSEENNQSFVVAFAEAGGGTVPQKGQLKLKKVDNLGNVIAGVEFKLYSTTGTFLESLTTDSNGEATTANKYRYHSSGNIKYKLEEVSVPDGHLNSGYAISGGKEITFKNAATTFEIENPKIRQSIELTKTQADGTTPLAGVKFDLYKKDGANYTKIESGLVTDANGKIVRENLAPGNYRMIETEALSGYWLDTTPVNFTVTFNQVVTTDKTMKNYPQGNLRLKKVDEATNLPLAGAIFKLYDGGSEIATVTTAANGEAEFTNIKYGTYTLKETTAPTGYLLDATSTVVTGQSVTVDAADKDLGTFTNKKIHQAFELIKRDVGDASKLLADAEFTLFVESAGTYVVATDVGGNEYTGLKTNDSGKIQVGDLPAGNYRLKETKAPAYYLLDTAANYDFAIAANQTVFTNVLVNNTRGKGSIKITKVDKNDHTILIPDTTFKLKNSVGDVVYGAATTDASGEIVFSGLPYDTYTLTEVTPHTDYLADTTPITIELDAGTDGVTETKLIENQKADRSVQLTKFNTNKSLTLAGAVFELRKKNGSGEYVVVTGYETNTTDASGVIKIVDLPVGNYQFIETQAPVGYKLDNTPINFEIKAKQDKTIQLEMTNDRRSSGGGGGGGFTPPITPEDPEDKDKDKEKDPEKDKDPEKKDEPKEEPKDEPKDGPKDEKPVDEPKDGEEPKDPGTGKPEDPYKEKTIEDTPKEGKVEVPEKSTPKVGEEPKNGTVTVDENGKWTYTPKQGFVGKDSFTVIVVDEDGNEMEIFFEMEVDGVPLGTAKLPKTGADSYLGYYLLGLGMILLGLGIRRKYS